MISTITTSPPKIADGSSAIDSASLFAWGAFLGGNLETKIPVVQNYANRPYPYLGPWPPCNFLESLAETSLRAIWRLLSPNRKLLRPLGYVVVPHDHLGAMIEIIGKSSLYRHKAKTRMHG